MRNKRNLMIMVVNVDGVGLEEAEMNWVEVPEIIKGRHFRQYRGKAGRREIDANINVQMRMNYMFGSYFNGLTEAGKKNPGLYEKLLNDERAYAGLIN